MKKVTHPVERGLRTPKGMTLRQAVAHSKAQIAARGLARQGRGSDTEVAHVARGEIVVPQALQNPEVLAALRRAAAAYGVPLEMLSVGNAMNRINPATGVPEFGVMDWISGLFSEKSSANNGRPSESTMLPDPRIDTESAMTPSYDALGFDPDGPGKWGAALRDLGGALKAKELGDQAREEAKSRYNGDQNMLVNGPGDAWRHARWNQLMTQSLGAERAKAFADAYERSEWEDNAPGEHLMDLYNNAVGRQLPNDPLGHMNPDTALQWALGTGYLRRKPF